MEGRGRERLIFALDVPDWAEAERWIERLSPCFGTFKVGLELFTSVGPEPLRILRRRGVPVFLDLKLHDIPTTVERAACAVRDLGVRMLTVHASGGAAMLEAAVRGAGAEVSVLGVTRLTSLPAREEEVVTLAQTAHDAGCAGVVCAGSDVASVRAALGPGPLVVCPGVRPAGVDGGEHSRSSTPDAALRAGASHLVVGRAVRDAPDPEVRADALLREVEKVLRSANR